MRTLQDFRRGLDQICARATVEVLRERIDDGWATERRRRAAGFPASAEFVQIKGTLESLADRGADGACDLLGILPWLDE